MTKPFQMMSEKKISSHMDNLLEEGLKAGMSQAEIIKTDKIVVDERVLYKCKFSCSGYNTCLSCPPFAMKPNETRELLKQYNYGILYRKIYAPEDFCGPESNIHKKWAQGNHDVQKIMTNLESSAFYKGFYFALAFGAGRCRQCSLEGNCKGLEKHICIQPYEKKSSMEAVGIDVYSTLRGLNWKVSVIGKNTDPKSIEIAGFCGLLLVY